MTSDKRSELLQELADAEGRARSLVGETKELVALNPRETLGNPFFYSHPKVPAEGATNFNGYSSHTVTLPTVQELIRVTAKIRHLRAQLAALE